jgi:hypothetical protein
VTEADAQTKLALMVLADEDPELSTQQVEDLVERSRRPDAEGRVHGDGDWEETFDLDAAAAEGWTRKAGLAASRFNFAEDGQSFDRAQVYANCIRQAEIYSRRSMGVIPLESEAA